MTQTDKLLKGLEHFNTWTQVLIGTAAAGIGWIAESQRVGWTLTASQWCLGTSILFGVLTMCQVPAMAQNASDKVPSVYQLRGHNYLLPFERFRFRPPIIMLCWPQHTLFIVAIVLYCI